MKVNNIWIYIGVVLFTVGLFDIIFYWPVTGNIGIFLIKKILYLVVGAFLILGHLIKPKCNNAQ